MGNTWVKTWPLQSSCGAKLTFLGTLCGNNRTIDASAHTLGAFVWFSLNILSGRRWPYVLISNNNTLDILQDEFGPACPEYPHGCPKCPD